MSSARAARPIYMSGATVVILHGTTEVASWPLAGADRPDLSLVDELAWLALAVRRAGYTVRVRDAGPELAGLLDLVGLMLCVEVRGQPEVVEQACVEEVVVADDPVAPHLDDLNGPR